MTLRIVKINSCVTSKLPIVTKNCLVIIELFADKFVPYIVNKMLHSRNDIYETVNKFFLLKFAIFFVFTKANEVAVR